MSDRDEIDVTQSVREKSPGNPKSRGLFDMVKKIFSTEDEQQYDDLAGAEPAAAAHSSDDIIKKADEAPEQHKADIQKTEVNRQTDTIGVDTINPNAKEAASDFDNDDIDPDEEEELLMIDAFFSGEEYTPALKEEKVDDVEDDEEDVLFEVDAEDDIDSVKEENQAPADSLEELNEQPEEIEGENEEIIDEDEKPFDESEEDTPITVELQPEKVPVAINTEVYDKSKPREEVKTERYDIQVENSITAEKPVEDNIQVEDSIAAEKPVEDNIQVEDSTTVEKPVEDNIQVEDSIAAEKPVEDNIQVENSIAAEKPVEDNIQVENSIAAEKPVEDNIQVENSIVAEKPVEDNIQVEDSIAAEKPVEDNIQVEDSIAAEKPVEDNIQVEDSTTVEKPVEDNIQVENSITAEKPVEDNIQVENSTTAEKPVEDTQVEDSTTAEKPVEDNIQVEESTTAEKPIEDNIQVENSTTAEKPVEDTQVEESTTAEKPVEDNIQVEDSIAAEKPVENTQAEISSSENLPAENNTNNTEEKQKLSSRITGFIGRAKAKLTEMWNAKVSEANIPEQNDGWSEDVDADYDYSEHPESQSAEKPSEVSEVSVEKAEDENTTDEKVTENPDEVVTENPDESVAENSEKMPQISVITGEETAHTEYDRNELRKSLNVIGGDSDDNDQLDSKITVTELNITDYTPAGKNKISFSVGRFTDAVRFEYECIVNYNKTDNVSSMDQFGEPQTEPVTKQQPEETPPQTTSSFVDFGLFDALEPEEMREFGRSHDKVDSIGKKLDHEDEETPEPIEYRTEEDALEVRKYLADKRSHDRLVSTVTAGLTAAAFLISLFAGAFTVGKGADSVNSSQRIFVLINLIMYGVSVFFCRDILIEGILPLKKFKANSDTGVAAAAAAAALQLLFALIAPRPFMGQGLNLYVILVMLSLSVTTAGRYMNSDRMLSNFRFVTDDGQKYAGKFFHDQRMVVRLLSGTKNDKTELTFQKKTSFLKHFMKLSTAEDPGDKLSTTFALPAIVTAVVVAFISAIVSKSFYDGISVLCIMLCTGIPITARALASVPVNRLSKKALANKSMIVGYKAVETFSDSAAVMIDARDLYPEGSIQLTDFKAIDAYHWQVGFYAAAAVTIASGGAMSGMFDGMIDKDAMENLPKAEGVTYEDGKGLVGWVNNDRIYVGNRKLLKSHGIAAPSQEDEDRFKANGEDILYIAAFGRLVGVLFVRYTANHRVSDVLKRMEASDMSLLVRTTDVNITAEKISRDFGIGLKSIKILEQKNSNVIRDEMVGKEKSSPAFIATKGGVTSFGLAVSECIQTKRGVFLSSIVEIIGLLLKLLIVITIVLFPGVHQIGAVAMFIISGLWIAAVLAAPLFVRRMQN